MNLPEGVKVGGARFTIRMWAKDHFEDLKLYGRILYTPRVLTALLCLPVFCGAYCWEAWVLRGRG